MDTNNNYTQIMNGEKKPEEPKTLPRNVTIHTMPKRYKDTAPSSKNAKSTGFFILVFGFLFLVVLFVSVYFLVIKKDRAFVQDDPASQSQQDDNSENKGQKDNVPKTDENAEDQNEQAKNEVANEKQPKDIATTTEEKEIKKVNVNNASSTVPSRNDSDGDGLSDLEELLLGSSPNSEDSDGDGYADLSELMNLYDPASKGKLIDSLNVSKFVNEDYDYSFYVSSVWVVDKFAGFDTLFVELGKDQFFQIVSQENTDGIDIEDWYKEVFDTELIPEEQIYMNGDWKAIRHEQGYTVYLEHPNKSSFITINYELGTDNTPYYKNMFELLVKSMAVED